VGRFNEILVNTGLFSFIDKCEIYITTKKEFNHPMSENLCWWSGRNKAGAAVFFLHDFRRERGERQGRDIGGEILK
jgi:hypothetical protein